jgi:hypothetical protein
VNRPLGLLRTLLRQALRRKFISEVPEIELEDESAGVVRFLRPDEATRLLADVGRAGIRRLPIWSSSRCSPGYAVVRRSG